MLDNDLPHLDALDERIRIVDDKLRELASHSINVKLLMTIPGLNVTVATRLVAASGNIARFDSPQKLAVEEAQCMVNSGAPLTASYHRIRRRKSHNVAVVALARASW